MLKGKTMKRALFAQQSLLLVLLLVASEGKAYPGEGIMKNSNGDYIITYWDTSEPPGLETEIFVPATKIAANVRSSFKPVMASKIQYRYSVTNGNNAQQSIVSIFLKPVESVIGARDTQDMKRGTAVDMAERLAVLTANEKALSTPNKWDGSVNFNQDERFGTHIQVSWITSYNHLQQREEEGIHPGGYLQNFGFSSSALPGIAAAGLAGDAPVHIWSGEGPPEDSAIYNQLEEIQWNNYVTVSAAAPTIPVPTTFDAATLLDRIHTEMNSWPAKQLLDPAYAAQLDRYMVAAADAYRLNNAKAGKEHLKTIRKMLAKEHHNLDHDDEGDEDAEEHKTATRLTIDRLAARVLDFDLRYVLKRMEPEEGDSHH